MRLQLALLRRSATIYLFLLLLRTGFGRRVEIFSTVGQKTELGWERHRFHDTDPWNEETYPGANNSNERAYVSCALTNEPVDNWVFVPLKDSGNANRLHITTSYSLRDCGEHGRICKETFGLYFKLVAKGASDPVSSFDVSQWKLLSRLTGGERMRETGLMRNEETHTVVTNGSNVHFAFRDTGACVSVLSVRMYYELCSEDTLTFATFPETPTAAHVIETIDVKGRCVEHAEPIREGQPPMAMCRGDGQWRTTLESGCRCKPGYSPTAANQCAACPSSTFKSRAGDGDCRPCPDYATAEPGSPICKCIQGYYRTPEESPSVSCTKPPSKPSLPRIIEVDQNSVSLDWEAPANLGGRKELWYRWECPGCPRGIRASPSDARLLGRKLTLTGLDPGTNYNILLYAVNEVSALAPATAAYAIVEFTTLPLSAYVVTNLIVEVEQKDVVTISWQPPAVAQSKIEFEVEIRENNTLRHTLHTQETFYDVHNIKPYNRYEFRVRANVGGWGEYSAPLIYEPSKTRAAEFAIPNHSSASNPTTSSFFDLVPLWVICLLLLGILVICLFVILIVRQKTSNRKQMSDLDVLDTYKQDTMTPDYPSAMRSFVVPATSSSTSFPPKVNAPLIPTYGSNSPRTPHYGTATFRPYVDPTTYEDPNQALVEFTFDIDPRAVIITSIIGGGEFGDVCKGHLDRSIVSSSPGDKQVEVVAIKTCKPGSPAKAKADFLLEASIMGQFDHPNVIRLVGVVTKSEPVMIVTEFMANGSLDNYLRSRDIHGDSLRLPRLLEMMRSIAAGMKYLTDMGYVHRDLAARNVLVDVNLVCKIADFGLSRGVENNAEQEYTTNGGKIPVRWTAPEAITHRKFTASSDVWSFGVVMWEVMSMGERPYWEWTNQKVIAEVMHGYRLPAPLDCPASLHQLMLRCWQAERHDRPTFDELLRLLERFCRAPELVFTDLPRLATSMHNLAYQYDNSTPPPPPPPSSIPSTARADDFLRSIGLSHCIDRLHHEGVTTVDDLARLHHLDYLAFGMITEEYQRIREAIAASRLRPTPRPPPPSASTLPHHHHHHRAQLPSTKAPCPAIRQNPPSAATLARTTNPPDNGFFV